MWQFSTIFSTYFCEVFVIFNFDENYNNSLDIAWEKFINNEDYDYTFIRPEIFESWKRSRAKLVDPNQIKTTKLNEGDLKKRLTENSLLIDIVRPYMDHLYSIVEGSGYYLMLCDKDGYVLHLIGDDDMINEGKNTHLVIGANRSEAFAGTNAIGTCLMIKHPIQIWHGEHYIKSHKAYTCSGAPIFDERLNVLGCLNLTGRYTEAHLHTLGMVTSAVDGIRKEMKIRLAYREISMISAQRNSIIEAVKTGLILLSKNDIIIQINHSALKMLNLKYENTINKNISELISINDPRPQYGFFSSQDTEFADQEVNIYHCGFSLPPIKHSLSVGFVDNSEGERIGTLVRLHDLEKLKRLASKISGYKSNFTFDSIIGNHPSIQELIRISKRVAKADSNILILGESGTGKEMIAQSIHNESKYAEGPFIAINCGALPKGLIESELFGYEKGAFTGANKEGNPGKFELAEGGTIFLDEIGDMPLDVQVTLLRVLQSKEVLRIGAKYPKVIDVRIIAATNQNLTEAIETKSFREDLYYRLNVLTLHIPPLRDRGNDPILLAEFFLKKYNDSKDKHIKFSPEALDIIQSYPWRGNVRELENAIERVVNITEDDIIRLEHFSRQIRDFHVALGESISLPKASTISNELYSLDNTVVTPAYNIESFGKQLILSSLEKTEGSVKKAADLLGISRRTLYRKIEKYNINFADYRK